MTNTNNGNAALSMSDEEFLKLGPSAFADEAVEETKGAVTDEEVVADPVEEDTTPDTTATEDDSTDETQESDKEDEDQETEQKSTETNEPEDTSASTGDAEEVAKSGDTKVEEKAEFDYKAAYEKLTAPFKANGKEIQVKGVEDAVALMQMGANYNKKMAGLKPSLKILKLLENNGLLDESKLSFLIDLDKRDPKAINKLVNESGIDPMDLSADNASEYRPSTYTVDERELELDAVLKDLEDSPAYGRTLEVVGSKWDGASKQAIASQPEVLRILNDHVERGIYDRIASRVESERMFGRLNGLSDLQAYKQVGDTIQAEGGFADLVQQKQSAPNQPMVGKPKPNKVDEAKLKEKKRAASSTKAVVPSSDKSEFNPLAMSDEEFMKQAQAKFI